MGTPAVTLGWPCGARSREGARVGSRPSSQSHWPSDRRAGGLQEQGQPDAEGTWGPRAPHAAQPRQAAAGQYHCPPQACPRAPRLPDTPHRARWTCPCQGLNGQKGPRLSLHLEGEEKGEGQRPEGTPCCSLTGLQRTPSLCASLAALTLTWGSEEGPTPTVLASSLQRPPCPHQGALRRCPQHRPWCQSRTQQVCNTPPAAQELGTRDPVV